MGLLGAVLTRCGLAKAESLSCGPTPHQIEGPFYPVDRLLGNDNDLTYVKDRPGRAEGELIYVRGQVLDENCTPVSGVLVDIWQANAHGRYNHPADANNSVPIDPNFQGAGQTVTDKEGKYLFKSILPGSYPVDDTWTRPSHIHFKVNKRGFNELITQMYFEGNKFNATDSLLSRVPDAEKPKLVIKSAAPEIGFDHNSKLYTFNLTLTRVG